MSHPRRSRGNGAGEFTPNYGDHAAAFATPSPRNYPQAIGYNTQQPYVPHHQPQAPVQVMPQVSQSNPVLVPNYAIRIFGIRPTGQQLHNGIGRWVPNNAPGTNERILDGTSNNFFIFDGTHGRLQEQVQAPGVVPHGYEPYATASVYYTDDDAFYVFQDNIVVYTGVQGYEWGRNLFSQHEVNGAENTYIMSVGAGNRLLHQRNQNCPWVRKILPRRYRKTHGFLETAREYRGSLKGEIAMLVALQAFSVPEARVRDALVNGIGLNKWTAPVIADEGRRHKRGMVVEVWVPRGQGVHMPAYEQSDSFYL